MTRDRRLPLVAIALALAAGAVHFADAPPPLRIALVLLFLAVGPGLAMVGLLRLDDPLEELLLVVGASLVLDLLVAEALVVSSEFSAGRVHAGADGHRDRRSDRPHEAAARRRAVNGGVAVALVLVVLLAELHLLAVAGNRRVARRRWLLAPLFVTLYVAFGAVVAVTIGEALAAQ